MVRALLIVLSFIVSFSCSKVTSSPDELAGMKLVKVIKGEKAIESINKLHGKKIEMKKGLIAIYKGDGKEAILWISWPPSIKIGKKQVRDMINSIKKNPHSPFRNIRKFNKAGVLIYTFSGLGKEHAVFTTGEKVYWVSTTPGILLDTLRDLL